LKFICAILFIAPIFCNGQSICIDSSTVKKANIYLIKGAKAREDLALYRKMRRVDSIYIDTLRSVNKTYLSQNAELLDASAKIKQQRKYLLIYSIFITLWQIFKK
jgi:hypothetical protein